MPWRPESTRRAIGGAIRVRMRDEPEHVPAHRAVVQGLSAPAIRVDDGRIDRVLRRYAPAVQVSRAFSSARHVGRPADAHRDWDDLEREVGLSRTLRVRFDPGASVLDAVLALRELDAVEFACPEYLCETPFAADGNGVAQFAGWRLVGAREALEREPGDPTLIVAVIDSGVALQHPDLRERLRAGVDLVNLPDEQISSTIHLLGDFTGRDRDPQDEQGHGTACAGILGAIGLGVPPGIAGRARILPMRALAGAKSPGRSTPTAIGSISDIDAAVKLAVDLGARVLNLSFGTPSTALRDDDPVPHVEVIRYALSRGCVLVAASGNAGDDVPYYPAALPGVIAVGAVGADGVVVPFSSRGPHVAICAPGRDLAVLSIEGYKSASGTSFAAPFVAGAAALLLARAARYAVALDPLEVKRILTETAAPFATKSPGSGVGILRIPEALDRLTAELSAREVA